MFQILTKSNGYGLNIVKCSNYLKNHLNYRLNHTETPFQGFIPFLDVLKSRQDEASRSILVQVQSARSYKELYTYCSTIGVIKDMFHYTFGVDPMHFILVEFENKSDVDNIMLEATYIEENQMVPTQSQFLWFRSSNKKSPKLKQNSNAKLKIEDGTNCLKNHELNLLLSQCKTLSYQIETLYEQIKLNDLGSRLRFLTARQIETAVKGLFPDAVAIPFGSSVNGFGKMGCDLDLVLRLTSKDSCVKSRLVYQCKSNSNSDRVTNQRHMETIGDLIQLFVPGCIQIRKILQARVPIIKYNQHLTDIECDLSMSNLSGVYMSDLLYLMGEIDRRVRPLVFTVRRWANDVGLTNSSPGRWITNFSLTLLVIAFLQKPLHSPPVLPSLNSLIKSARSHDRYVTEDGIDCTFLRDIKKFNFKSDNQESLESLLIQFFEFYSQFDFKLKAICLNSAVPITKPEHSALYIVNPLERGLNVSKNVSMEELERFQLEARNAAWILESNDKQSDNFGLLEIFKSKNRPNLFNLDYLSQQKHRLVEISTLFDDEDSNSSTSSTDKIEYKNDQIRKQINEIKQKNQNKINELKKSNR